MSANIQKKGVGTIVYYQFEALDCPPVINKQQPTSNVYIATRVGVYITLT